MARRATRLEHRCSPTDDPISSFSAVFRKQDGTKEVKISTTHVLVFYLTFNTFSAAGIQILPVFVRASFTGSPEQIWHRIVAGAFVGHGQPRIFLFGTQVNTAVCVGNVFTITHRHIRSRTWATKCVVGCCCRRKQNQLR